jgi:hypothetical protein
MLGTLAGAPGELARQQVSQLLGDGYHRLQTELPSDVDHAMDDVRPVNVAALGRAGDALVRDSTAAIDRILERLG